MFITQVVLLLPHLYFKLFEFKGCILSGSTVLSQVLRTEQSKINASVNARWKNKCNGLIKTRYSYHNKTKLKLSTYFSCLTIWMGILSPFIPYLQEHHLIALQYRLYVISQIWASFRLLLWSLLLFTARVITPVLPDTCILRMVGINLASKWIWPYFFQLGTSNVFFFCVHIFCFNVFASLTVPN